jgi:hypothetical protein
MRPATRPKKRSVSADAEAVITAWETLNITGARRLSETKTIEEVKWNGEG